MLFALHLPNHSISPEVTIGATLVAVAFAVAMWMRRSSETQPSLGRFAAVTALLFAVQLVNFPLVGGATSGHLLGTAAAVMLLGPLAGAGAVALVLLAQSLLLGDGGATALGANILNMSLAATVVSALAAACIRQQLVGAFVAGWASTVVAAMLCAAELAASGVGTPSQLLTLVGQHALLGIAEGAFTVAVVFATARSTALRPLAVATVVALALAPLASQLPDTLETVIAPISIDR